MGCSMTIPMANTQLVCKLIQHNKGQPTISGPQKFDLTKSKFWIYDKGLISHLTWDPVDGSWKELKDILPTRFFKCTSKWGYHLCNLAWPSPFLTSLAQVGLTDVAPTWLLKWLWHNIRPKKVSTLIWTTLNSWFLASKVGTQFQLWSMQLGKTQDAKTLPIYLLKPTNQLGMLTTKRMGGGASHLTLTHSGSYGSSQKLTHKDSTNSKIHQFTPRPLPTPSPITFTWMGNIAPKIQRPPSFMKGSLWTYSKPSPFISLGRNDARSVSKTTTQRTMSSGSSGRWWRMSTWRLGGWWAKTDTPDTRHPLPLSSRIL
jgi:hypothetical protein